MKKVFIAISFIMAISIIPVIYNVIDNVMTENISIEFTLTDIETGAGSITAGTYDKLIPYLEADEALDTTLFVENEQHEDDFILYKNDDDNIVLTFPDTWEVSIIELLPDNTFLFSQLLPVQENMSFRVEFGIQTSGLWSVLLSLMPLVFVGGIVLYFVNKNGLSE